MAEDRQAPTPGEQVARLYEDAETEAAKASERLVASRGFASLLGQMAENAAALTRLGSDAMDLVLRNLRLAGRRDVARLGRQLARTEDKLELVLQELERVRDELERVNGSGSTHEAAGATDTGPAATGDGDSSGSPHLAAET
jgi:hypothetical protein